MATVSEMLDRYNKMTNTDPAGTEGMPQPSRVDINLPPVPAVPVGGEEVSLPTNFNKTGFGLSGTTSTNSDVGRDVQAMRAGPAPEPAAAGQEEPPNPLIEKFQTPETRSVAPPPATWTPADVTANGGYGVNNGEKLNPEITAFATKPPAENQFDDKVNREIMRLQTGEYSSLAGKNVVSPEARATIAQLMLGQRSGEATLQQADVSGRYGLAGHVINWGERNELRRLALEQKASENATREKDFQLRMKEIESRNQGIEDDKSLQRTQKQHDLYSKSPEGDNFHKGLVEMVHQGIPLHESYKEAGRQAYLPIQNTLDLYQKTTGKEPSAQQKEYAKNLHYFNMGWITKKPTKPQS